jgi:ankyrin repeat protein
MNEGHHFHNHNGECHHCNLSSTLGQTLEELDFEKGLWGAARDGDIVTLQKLLGRGRNPSQKDASGYTPLHYAARAGHTNICKLLLEKGADVNAVTESGRSTPLHRAAFCGHVDVVQLLLHFEANPNIQDADGCTPLHKAASQNKGEVVRLLLMHGANPSLVDNHNKRPSDYAVDRAILSLFSQHLNSSCK